MGTAIVGRLYNATMLRGAIVLGLALAGCNSARDEVEQKREAVGVELEGQETAKRAADLQGDLDRAMAELAKVVDQLNAAQSAIMAAQSDAERDAAMARMSALLQKRNELEARIKKARAAAEKAKRAGGS
jgi:hypothetical protein